MQADEYVLLGAALALEIAEGLSGDALDVAAALYTAIGDRRSARADFRSTRKNEIEAQNVFARSAAS